MDSYVIWTVFITFIITQIHLISAQSYTSLGCFYDNPDREVLPDLIFCTEIEYPYESCLNLCGPRKDNYCQSNVMTIELCYDICLDQNMRYFGLQAGSQCLCGGFSAPYNDLGSPTMEACSYPCNGNSTQFCGGEFQISTYEINTPASGSDCFNPGYILNVDQLPQSNVLYSVNDTIEYDVVCPSPSIQDGASSITCTSNGNWTDEPPNCIARCPTPNATANAVFSAGQTLNDSYAVDEVVLFDCEYDPSKTNQALTCGYYGTWETFVVCPENNMSTPSPTTNAPSTPQATTKMASTRAMTTSSTTEQTTIGMTTSGQTTSSPPSSTTSSKTMSSTDRPSTMEQSSSVSMTTDTVVSSRSMMTGGGVPSATSRTTSPSGTSIKPTSGGLASEGGIDLVIIIAAAAGGCLLLIIIVIVVSVCVSKKRKQQTKNIPFDPDMGTSFGNPAFDEDPDAENRRGFVHENDYGDLHHQKYEIDTAEFAMTEEDREHCRAPPDGKDSDSPQNMADRAGLDKNRNGTVSSFKPANASTFSSPPSHNLLEQISSMSPGFDQSFIHEEEIDHSEDYFSNPDNHVATQL